MRTVNRSRAFYKVIFLCFAVFFLTGCNKEVEKEKKKEIKIPVCFSVDQKTGKSDNENLVDAFNKKYKGTYQLEVEWVTDSAEGFRDRIKVLNATDKLPAIVTDVGFDANFYRLLVDNNRLLDLTAYFNKDEEWKSALDQKIMERCVDKNGSTYLMPLGTMVHSYAGFYYNKELFQQAGIEKFPTTWDEFFICLRKLKNHGITPLALHGGNSYWTALLIGTNYMARNQKGMDFLNIQYPSTYQTESMKDMLSMIKKLYQYADKDALEIEHGESRKRFIEGKSAIMANGGWMLENLPSDFRKKTGFAPFPENILMEEPKMTAWAITTGYDKEVIKGAVEFLKFRTMIAKKDSDEFLEKKNVPVLEKEYKEVIKTVQTITPNYQLKWEDEIQNQFWVSEFPLFIQGKTSMNKFLKAMDQKVKEIESEK